MELEVAVPFGVEWDMRGGGSGFLQVVSEVGADETDGGRGVDEAPADLEEVSHVVDEHVFLQVAEELLDVHGLDGRGDGHVQRLEPAVAVRADGRVPGLGLRDDHYRLRRLARFGDDASGGGRDAGESRGQHYRFGGVTCRRRKWNYLGSVLYFIVQ